MIPANEGSSISTSSSPLFPPSLENIDADAAGLFNPIIFTRCVFRVASGLLCSKRSKIPTVFFFSLSAYTEKFKKVQMSSSEVPMFPEADDQIFHLHISRLAKICLLRSVVPAGNVTL